MLHTPLVRNSLLQSFFLVQEKSSAKDTTILQGIYAEWLQEKLETWKHC